MGLKTLFYLEQGSILLYSLVTLFPLISIQTPCFCPHLTFPQAEGQLRNRAAAFRSPWPGWGH